MLAVLLIICAAALGALAGWFAPGYVAKLVKAELPEEYEQSGLRTKKTRICSCVLCGAACFLSALVMGAPSAWLGLLCAIACIALLCMAFSDFFHCIIFDRFQLAFGLLAVARLVCSLLGIFGESDFWISSVLGFCFGLLLYGLIAVAGSRILGKDAMGWGDVKLAACSGLFLGWKGFLLSTLIAAIAGSIILLVLAKAKNHEKHREYPFAPFMVAGIIIAMFAGDAIVNAYLSLFAL